MRSIRLAGEIRSDKSDKEKRCCVLSTNIETDEARTFWYDLVHLLTEWRRIACQLQI